MRDTQALEIELGIEYHLRTEIGLEQPAIFVFKNIEGERIASLLNRVNVFFELGEHRLPEERAADVVDLAIDDVGAHFRVVSLREEMVREQPLVEGRRHLREEDRILGVLKSLGPLREPGMH